jgi:hypothetical protein
MSSLLCFVKLLNVLLEFLEYKFELATIYRRGITVENMTLPTGYVGTKSGGGHCSEHKMVRKGSKLLSCHSKNESRLQIGSPKLKKFAAYLFLSAIW